MNFMLTQIDGIGRRVIRNLEYTLKVLLMGYLSVRSVFTDRSQAGRTIYGVVSQQIYFTGWQAMPLISVLALGAGGIVILQTLSNLNYFGGTEMVGKLLVVIVVREVGPLLTALVVIARSGTAVASEVGNMRANREIEALESMGINPLSYIVFPRIVGGILSVVCLSIYFILISLLGGFLLTKMIHGIPLSFYANSLAQALSFEDVWLFLLKSLFSGGIIFVVSCFQGLEVKSSPTEVPMKTTQAVVNSIVYVCTFNFSITILFYLNELRKLGVFG